MSVSRVRELTGGLGFERFLSRRYQQARAMASGASTQMETHSGTPNKLHLKKIAAKNTIAFIPCSNPTRRSALRNQRVAHIRLRSAL